MTRFPARWPKKPRRTTEHDLQKAAIQWLRLALAPPAFAWSVDHAGGGILAGALRKARGVRAGQPDIWVLGSERRLIGIELKSAKGRASDAQITFGRDCHQCGVPVVTCFTIEQIEGSLRCFDIPLRATLAPEPAAVKGARETA